jgi:hypothetical protein
MKMNGDGALVIKVVKPLRKLDFNKIRDKEIPVKPEHIEKMEAKVRAMKQGQGRRLEGEGEA